jgi:hypothetical protein
VIGPAGVAACARAREKRRTAPKAKGRRTSKERTRARDPSDFF